MEGTWRLVDERVHVRQKTRDQTRIWRLSRAITEILKEYRRQREETSGEDVEALLGADPPIPQEEWQQIKGC